MKHTKTKSLIGRSGHVITSATVIRNLAAYAVCVVPLSNHKLTLGPHETLTFGLDHSHGPPFENPHPEHFILSLFFPWTSSLSLRFLSSRSPVPKLRWKKVDGLMPSKAGSSVASPTLLLPDLSFDDEGVYECEAHNSEGVDVYQGRISVQGICSHLFTSESVAVAFIFDHFWKMPFSMQFFLLCFSSARLVAGDE